MGDTELAFDLRYVGVLPELTYIRTGVNEPANENRERIFVYKFVFGFHLFNNRLFFRR